MNSVVPGFAVDSQCYHCGLPVPSGIDLVAQIGGSPRAMCCAGCQAVAEAVVSNGLSAYYEKRDALPESPRDIIPAALQELEWYDQPALQASLVIRRMDAMREASLLVEGITCGACIWLIEKRVLSLPGVHSIAINYATRRARLAWDQESIRLSAILRAIAAIGYRATPYDAARAETAYRRERNDALKRLFVAGFGMMQVMMYAVPVYLADEGSMSADIEQLMRVASLMLTVPVVFYSARPLLANAMRDLRAGRAGMDVPVALGIAVAFVASAFATFSGGGEVYFDSIAMFVFLLLAARYFELVSRRRAAAGIERLTQSAPAMAQRLIAFPDLLATQPVAAISLVAGDHVLIAPGASVPADGTVVSGSGKVDEALLTGESEPQKKAFGSALIGGSINLDSPLVMMVACAGDATRLSAIMRLLERALSEKPRIVELADRVAAWFVTALLLVTLATGMVWLMLDPARAPWVIVAVLVVTCPCALSLATPVALTAATAQLAAMGVLVTRGHAIETLARADYFVFDKTGTLTTGDMRIARVLTAGTLDETACMDLAAAMEQGVAHPIARAILNSRAIRATRDAAATSPLLPVPEDIRVVQGAGIEARVHGELVRVGSVEFVSAITHAMLPLQFKNQDHSPHTRAALGTTRGWLALFEMGDGMRAGAGAIIDTLKKDGMRVMLLSGDERAAVKTVADQLCIEEWRAGLSPEDKHEVIVQLQRNGATVAMIGDGVNDAPVLAQAQVSVAIGSGAALAQMNADMVLLGSDLSVLAQAIGIARRTMRVTRQNLAWAVGYNALALPLAIGGWLSPWMAGLGMAASSLLVVLNALRVGTDGFAPSRVAPPFKKISPRPA